MVAFLKHHYLDVAPNRNRFISRYQHAALRRIAKQEATEMLITSLFALGFIGISLESHRIAVVFFGLAAVALKFA
jgi:hypothetical protein